MSHLHIDLKKSKKFTINTAFLQYRLKQVMTSLDIMVVSVMIIIWVSILAVLLLLHSNLMLVSVWGLGGVAYLCYLIINKSSEITMDINILSTLKDFIAYITKIIQAVMKLKDNEIKNLLTVATFLLNVVITAFALFFTSIFMFFSLFTDPGIHSIIVLILIWILLFKQQGYYIYTKNHPPINDVAELFVSSSNNTPKDTPKVIKEQPVNKEIVSEPIANPFNASKNQKEDQLLLQYADETSN